jgi:hypothetical protein
MSDDERRGVCVVCARPGATGTITLKSEKHPERTYEFYIHRECLKDVAKPGFVGLDEL